MFGLEKSNVVLDDQDFAAFREVNTDDHYHAGRIDVKGMLQYGLVPEDDEVRIDLAANGITTPIMVESIFAITPNGSADEVTFYLYVKQNGNLVKIGQQRVSSGQMPYDIPDGILAPDMVLGIKPTRSDATITVYVKPVAVSFVAVPNPGDGDDQ
ncbi:MAG: hypothetical protein AAGF26_14220 [Cyanobacteria bacterium P01_G01_bin.49]